MGAVSDAFTARFAHEALRYSLLIPTIAPILSVLVCVVGARSVGRDMDRVRAANVQDAVTEPALVPKRALMG